MFLIKIAYGVVIIACNDYRIIMNKFSNALKDIFRMGSIRKVLYKLIVNGEVRGKDKKFLMPLER